MLELNTVKEILKHHSPKDFEFLSVPANSKNRYVWERVWVPGWV